MVITLICAIPITAIVVGFITLKAVSLGLKWQIQAKEGKEPELKSPISPIVEAVQQKETEKKAQYSVEQMREWSPFQ